MVHETMHAIQDARFHLEELYTIRGTDLDRALAIGAVPEGEATYIGDLAAAAFFGLGKDDIDWPGVFGRWQQDARYDARSSPRPVTLAWAHFRYPFGTAYVKSALDAAGWERVETLYDLPPESTRQVMAGFGAAEPGGGAWAEDFGGGAIPILDPSRYDYVGADRLGAWLLEAFFARAPHFYRGEKLMPLFRGDVLSIFHDRVTGGAVAFWRLRFAPDEDLSTLSERVGLLPAARKEGAGTDDVIVAASDSITLDAVPARPSYQPIPPAPAAAPFAARQAGAGCVRLAPVGDAP
jgi:hypothetical protein